MKTGFSILYLIFSSVMVAQSVHLTIPAVDSSNNAVTIGTAYFTWGQFTGNNGVTVQAGQLTRPVSNGTIDVTLTASDNAGYVYTLLFMHGSTADTFKWRVPAAGATTMAQLKQPAATSADATVVHTDQPNNYTAGKKQTFTSSATTAGEGFGGIAADPSTVAAGDRWFRTDISHMRIYDGTTGQTVMYRSDTLPANQLTNPTAATSLLLAANPFNMTFGNTTGSGNMMTVVDTASNTGTGYVFTAGTASGSSANPLQVLCGGTQCTSIDQYGRTIMKPTSSVPINTGVLTVQTSSGASLALFDSSGRLYLNAGALTSFGPTTLDVALALSPRTTATKALLIRETSGYVGSTTLLSVQNNGGTDLFSVNGNGTATIAGMQTATVKKTANYTATSDDLSVPCDATAGAVVITLPAAPKTGEWKALKKVDASANSCTYSGNGKNIEGASTLVYSTQYQHALAQYDGTQWWLY